jgi:AAA family ATP:ADP antiporter
VSALKSVHLPNRRWNAVVCFSMLFGLMCGYALLETARDALFLAHLSPAKLPWAYLTTAAAVTLVATLIPSMKRDASRRRSAATLLVAAAVALALYLYDPRTALGLYALYASVGVAGTVLIVQTWTLIGAQFSVGDARRLFAIVASGGVLGAVVAADLAARVVRAHGAGALIGVAALAFALTAGTPFLLRTSTAGDGAVARQEDEASVLPLQMMRVSYARRLFWMVALTSIACTLGDFVFKSVVAASVPADELGVFFARYQMAMNLIGLVMQVLIVPLILRRVAANRMVLVLPALFVATGVVLAIVPGLVASMILKSVDSVLRNSVHRTSTELLYLPLPFEVRGRLKTIIDGVGQRSAQAFASLLVLAGLVLGATPAHVALAVAMSAGACLGVAAGLRRRYVEVFRDQLREGKLDLRAERSQLDLASVESLLAGLSSPNAARVLAALEALAAQGKAKLIPSLLLHHPSENVALRTLELLSDAGRRDFLPLTEALLAHPSAAVRGAASRGRAEVIAEEHELRRLADDPRPEVQAGGLVGLLHFGGWKAADGERLTQLIGNGAFDAKLSVLQAIVRMPHPTLSPMIASVHDGADPQLQLEAVRALQACGDPRFLARALELLAVRSVRDAARRVFLDAGAAGVEFLGRALDDSSLPIETRRHVPRTLSRLGTQRAATLLLGRLARPDGDGVFRYKMLRGLGRMKSNNPRLRLDRRLLERLARESIRRIATLRLWRSSLDGGPRTASSTLLKALLARKERMAIERLFRYLDLLRTGQDMERVFHGLTHPDPRRRASSRELLEYLVHPALRREVLALIDDAGEADDDRSRFSPLKVEQCLAAMRQDHSSAIRALVEEYAPADAQEVTRAS